jgi:hypothetical protein
VTDIEILQRLGLKSSPSSPPAFILEKLLATP